MRVNVIVLAVVAVGGVAEGQLIPQQPNTPFSAEITTTDVQTLADGTHITKPGSTIKTYRDSLGRTRTENYFTPPSPPGAPPKLQGVRIVDPVEGANYFLNPEKKTAQKMVVPKPGPPQTLSPAVVQALATAPKGTAVMSTPSGVVYVNAHPIGIGDPSGPSSKTESLGKQTIEGVIAEGHRATMTYAVGTVGNDREIVVTHEYWTAEELGLMTMLSRDSDPRTGERTTKLTNLNRGEPDPALFHVPADYTIEAEQVSSRIRSAVPAPASK